MWIIAMDRGEVVAYYQGGGRWTERRKSAKAFRSENEARNLARQIGGRVEEA